MCEYLWILLLLQHTRECVAKTLKRLEDKIHGRVSRVKLFQNFLTGYVIQQSIMYSHIRNFESLVAVIEIEKSANRKIGCNCENKER